MRPKADIEADLLVVSTKTLDDLLDELLETTEPLRPSQVLAGEAAARG